MRVAAWITPRPAGGSGAALCLVALMSLQALSHAQAQQPGVTASREETSSPGEPLEEVVVTAERRGLIGTATTASEGVVVNDELALTPAYRPGQLLETVPGLVVTSHSGEGKANQYQLRGFQLDHGTDFEITLDGMPLNMPTHGHGQGYADANFMIPELLSYVIARKGPYFADEGDFSAAGAAHMQYKDDVPGGLF